MDSFYRHRDGEEEYGYHSIATYVQGSLAEERRKSTGRYSKDLKEVKRIRALNRKFRISLYSIFDGTYLVKDTEMENYTPGILEIEKRLSHLEAEYPSLPGLGFYISGLGSLEGKGRGKKIFDLLFWISSTMEMNFFYKFILLERIGKIVLIHSKEGKWMQNSTILLSSIGRNEFAYLLGEQILENKSAIRDSLEKGKRLAQELYLQFYPNVRMYKTKNRKRGYSDHSSMRPNSTSFKAIQAANSSIEYLTEEGILKKSETGGYELMEQKQNLEDLLLEIFKNSAEAFEFYQKEIKEQRDKEKENSTIQKPISDKEGNPEEPSTS